jgi:hypothetical protein
MWGYFGFDCEIDEETSNKLEGIKDAFQSLLMNANGVIIFQGKELKIFYMHLILMMRLC